MMSKHVRYWALTVFVLLIGARPVMAQAVTDQSSP